jgi:ferritin-like metal-binding protein YciE
MEGLVVEGAETMGEDYEDDVMDAALIAAAQRVEHYEIAAYGTVRTYAELLGEDTAVQLLEQTLEEEKETDQKLTDMASEINVRAMGEGSEAGSEDEEEAPARKKAKTARA